MCARCVGRMGKFGILVLRPVIPACVENVRGHVA